MMNEPKLEEPFITPEMDEAGKQTARALLLAAISKAEGISKMTDNKQILLAGAAAIMLGGLCFGLAALFEQLSDD